MSMMRAACAVLLILGGSQIARAEWFEATSAHFIVYADGDVAQVRRQAEQLERFDSVIRYFRAMPAREEDAANKVTVYVLPNVAAVQRLCGGGCRDIAGFYQGRASGSVAYTPARGGEDDSINALRPQVVLFHEYAHHLLLGNFAAAYPAWFSEGYAEFVSTAKFDKTSVWIGGAAQHRAYSLLMQAPLSAERLFANDPRKMNGEQIASLYARGWLLTHYIMLDAKLRDQFQAYQKALNAGTPSIDAARQAFGDLKALDRSLDDYLHRSRLSAFQIPLARLPQPHVALRPLSAGERAMIDLRMRSDRGVNRDTAQPILAKAIPVGARFPDDPVVQGWLAEMALDAGRNDLAEAAADRALAADPRSAQALIYKAQVHLRRAAAGHATDPAVWKEARGWLLKANAIDANDAYALTLYYSSFGMAQATPTANAVAALRRSLELVPQDDGVRFAYARQSLIDGKRDEARVALRPLAYAPHAGPDNPAARLLALIDAGQAGQAAIDALAAEAEADGGVKPGGTPAGGAPGGAKAGGGD